MVSNVGHTIQKIINNTPVSISANETTTSVVTSGGNVYQAGLIGNRIQNQFKEVIANENIIGNVIDAKSTDNSVYFLNSTGSVFQYDFTAGECSPVVREVYSPTVCDGDKAIKIETGRDHVVILTKDRKAYGAGDNSEYQIVPQGQCRYDVATEIIVTDTNIHDNCSCKRFTGTLQELEKPKIPAGCTGCDKVVCIDDPNDTSTGCCPKRKLVKTVSPQCCGKVNCIKRDVCCKKIRATLELNSPGLTYTPLTGSAVTSTSLTVDLYFDFSYVGFLCVDCHGKATGTVTTTVTKIYYRKGCQTVTLGATDIQVIAAEDIVIFDSTSDSNPSAPYTFTTNISGKCGEKVSFQLFPDPSVLGNIFSVTISVSAGFVTVVTPFTTGVQVTLASGTLTGSIIPSTATFDPINVKLDCCIDDAKKCDPVLPQPCWADVYAGQDISVLVDSCNRLYVLGSLHRVRNNKGLLQRSCLEDLLSRTDASISLPADQLNCCARPRNDNCTCYKCRDRTFETDLSKFGINLRFDKGGDSCGGDDWNRNHAGLGKVTNVCDFLKALQKCNDQPVCRNTCEPCDSYIYLDVTQNDCNCPIVVDYVTLYNRKSVCKTVSQDCADIVCIDVTCNSVVEFDLNHYCIDGTDYPLYKIIKLQFSGGDVGVDLYVDIDNPGGIYFTSDDDKYCGQRSKSNVEFTVDASDSDNRFILNYGSILDPVELTNLKQALYLDAFFPCPRFKNPFNTKLINTYLKGGDRVKFVLTSDCGIRQAVTADVPTVFKLNRRVLDVGVGHNNLSVLVGGLACPNEIFAIGENCHGELAIGSNESIVCWRQVNRCLFDCQVQAIFSGKFVTFYVTQSYRVYGSGQWKCLVDSNIPVAIPSFCQAWRIKEIAVSKNQIVLLGSDGCVFGLGDNSLGELGLCHVECVPKAVPLSFFYRLNQSVARQFLSGYKYDQYYDDSNCNSGCDTVVRYWKSPRGYGCAPKKYIPNARSCCIPANRYNKI